MLYGAEVVVHSQKNTKHINTVWAERKLLNVKIVGASRNQPVGFKRLKHEESDPFSTKDACRFHRENYTLPPG